MEKPWSMSDLIRKEEERSIWIPKELQESDKWEQVKEALLAKGFHLTVHGTAGRYRLRW